MDAVWVSVRNADSRRLRTSVIVSAIIWTIAFPFFALIRMQNPVPDTPSMNPVYIELAPPSEVPTPVEPATMKSDPRSETLPEIAPEPRTVAQPEFVEVPPVETRPLPEVADIAETDQRAVQTAPIPAVQAAPVAEKPATGAAPVREVPVPVAREAPVPAFASVPAETAPLATKPFASVPAVTSTPLEASPVAVKPVTNVPAPAAETAPVPGSRSVPDTAPVPVKRPRAPNPYQQGVGAKQVELSEESILAKNTGSESGASASSGAPSGSSTANSRVAVASGQRVDDVADRKLGELEKNLSSTATASARIDSQTGPGSTSTSKSATGTALPGIAISPGSGNLSGPFDFGGTNTRALVLGTKKVTIPPKDLRDQPDQLSTMVSFVIEPGGTVLSGTIRFEPPLSPAIEAILRAAFVTWQFSPADSDGRVEFRYSIKVR